MDKFLKLSFINQLRNNDEIASEIEKCYEPVIEALRETLSERKCAEIEELLSDCQCEAMDIAGVTGMELAIGVINGTIKQCIEG